MQLMVEKADGKREVYLHTKVLGTIAAVLGECEAFDAYCSEEMAETVSLYLRRRHGGNIICSDDIHSMILVVLADTGHEPAAQYLQEYRLRRKIRRQRVMVVSNGHDAFGVVDGSLGEPQPWNKSIIARDLEREGLEYPLARTVAGLVEEKVLRLESSQITTELIRALVKNEMMGLRQAQQALDVERQTLLREQINEKQEAVAAAC